MNAKTSDEQVMRRLAGGDHEALDELMARWQRPVWCFIRRLCASAREGEEIYQEVWTRLYLYRRRYRPSAAFKSYLFKIAVNCCRSALRSRAHEDRMWTGWDESACPGGEDGCDPLTELISREQVARLREAASGLPPSQRAVVLLYLVFATDYRQIAELMRTSVATARSHMSHALKSLRTVLDRMDRCSEGQVSHERSEQ